MNLDTADRFVTIRVSSKDAHYAGELVDGAFVMRQFGDAVTFATARELGDEGLLAAYEHVDFKLPVHPGDFITIAVEEVSRSRLSRTFELAAIRIGKNAESPKRPSATCVSTDTGEIVATAIARSVVPLAVVKNRG